MYDIFVFTSLWRTIPAYLDVPRQEKRSVDIHIADLINRWKLNLVQIEN